MISADRDVIVEISKRLTDKDKIALTMSSKKMDVFKKEFTYNEVTDLKKIENLPYFDSFEKIHISFAPYFLYRRLISKKMLPISVKQVYYTFCPPDTIDFNNVRDSMRRVLLECWLPDVITHLTYDCDKTILLPYDIPLSVTHLTFSDIFNKSIDNCIPPSVIYLQFGCSFNHAINNCIPESVQHLIFGGAFDKCIRNNIPSSVIYLQFGTNFNQPICWCIPPSVKHLVFGWKFNQKLDGIPTSVKRLSLGWSYNQGLWAIPKSVTQMSVWTHQVEIDDNDSLRDILVRNRIPMSVISLCVKNRFGQRVTYV